jgi:hypothetical protein
MEQCLQITDNNSQLIIHDYKTFAQVLMTYWLDIATRYPNILHQ